MDKQQEYEALRVVDLRKELKMRGASVSGRKSVLVQRLVLLDKATRERESEGDQVVVEVQDFDQTPSSSPYEVQQSRPAPAPWSPTLAKPLRKSAEERVGEEHKDDHSIDEEAVFSPPRSPKRNLFGEMIMKTTPKSSPKKARVSFGSVETRKYRMSHGGSTSTPSKGGYPLGLSWEVAGEVVKPLKEKDSPSCTNASPRRLNERQRKLLLEKVDHRSFFEKQASFETEKEELRQLRRARQNIGCNCVDPNSCGTSRCFCFKEGLSCNDDTCRCTCDNCINPLRYNFDQEKIDRYRSQRIAEAPYVSENAQNFSPIQLNY